MNTRHRALILGLLLGLGVAVFAGRNVTRTTLSGVARAVPNPTGAAVLDRLHPRNDGGYIAFWAGASADVIERRDAAGAQVWRRDFPPRGGDEDTRVVLDSARATFWASTKHYILLDNTAGTVLRAGAWDVPDLDMDKVLLRGDLLHIVQNGIATLFDTNLNAVGECEVLPPAGYWRQFADDWLIDLRDRTNQQVRVAVLGEGLEIVNLFTVPLPASAPGGYVDHTVLRSSESLVFVASRVSWITNSELFLTAFDRDGNVLLQTLLTGRDSLNGLAVLEDGWLLTGTGLQGGAPGQFLLRIGPTGIPQSREFYLPGDERRYFALNCNPPRILHMFSPTAARLLELTTAPWEPGMGDPDLDTFTPLAGAPLDMAESQTNHFWITPTRRNNSAP